MWSCKFIRKLNDLICFLPGFSRAQVPAAPDSDPPDHPKLGVHGKLDIVVDCDGDSHDAKCETAIPPDSKAIDDVVLDQICNSCTEICSLTTEACNRLEVSLSLSISVSVSAALEKIGGGEHSYLDGPFDTWIPYPKRFDSQLIRVDFRNSVRHSIHHAVIMGHHG